MENMKNMMENIDKSIETLDKNSKEEIDLLDMNIDIEENTEEEAAIETNLIKCGSNTDPNSLAYYIARRFEKTNFVIIQTIGPRALSKAILAIIRLKSIVAPYIDGSTIVARFSIRKLQLPHEEERTAIRIRLFSMPDTFVV